MIKTNLSLSRLRTILILLLLLLAISTSIFILLFVTTPRFSTFDSIYQFLSLFYQAFFLIVAPFLLFYTILFTQHIPFRMELEKRRQTAAHGDLSLFYTEQPIPNVSALSLPLTIKQNPNWSIATFILIPLCLSIFALTISHYLPGQTFEALLFIVSGILTICLWGLQLWAFYVQRHTQIIATEDGITVRGLQSKAHHIFWKDARLFAIADSVGMKKYPYPDLFELSSANEVIRWTWFRPRRRGTFFARPLIPPEEYDRQMQALHSLIAARTGLSLYDLRKRSR